MVRGLVLADRGVSGRVRGGRGETLGRGLLLRGWLAAGQVGPLRGVCRDGMAGVSAARRAVLWAHMRAGGAILSPAWSAAEGVGMTLPDCCHIHYRQQKASRGNVFHVADRVLSSRNFLCIAAAGQRSGARCGSMRNVAVRPIHPPRLNPCQA